MAVLFPILLVVAFLSLASCSPNITSPVPYMSDSVHGYQVPYLAVCGASFWDYSQSTNCNTIRNPGRSGVTGDYCAESKKLGVFSNSYAALQALNGALVTANTFSTSFWFNGRDIRWGNDIPFLTAMFNNDANSPNTQNFLQVYALDSTLAVVTLFAQPAGSWQIHNSGTSIGPIPQRYFTGPLFWGQYWSNIVITINFPKVSLYVNGTLMGSSTSIATATSFSNSPLMYLWMGSGPCPEGFVINNAFADENSRFLFDDVAFYKSVLPAADIAYLGAGGKATNITTPANVIAYWSFNDIPFNSNCCGDAYMTGTELCDDGNTDSGDGCSSTCVIESGWECTGRYCQQTCLNGKSVTDANSVVQCVTTCGNGITEGTEECDSIQDTPGCTKCYEALGYACDNNEGVFEYNSYQGQGTQVEIKYKKVGAPATDNYQLCQWTFMQWLIGLSPVNNPNSGGFIQHGDYGQCNSWFVRRLPTGAYYIYNLQQFGSYPASPASMGYKYNISTSGPYVCFNPYGGSESYVTVLDTYFGTYGYQNDGSLIRDNRLYLTSFQDGTYGIYVLVGAKKYYLYVPDAFYDYWVSNKWNFSYATSGVPNVNMYFGDEAIYNESDSRTHFSFVDYIKQEPILSRSSCSSICGDGITITPEQCDDKNTQAGDGCSSCQVENGWACSEVQIFEKYFSGNIFIKSKQSTWDEQSIFSPGALYSFYKKDMYSLGGKVMPQFTNFWTGSQWFVYSSNSTGPYLYMQNYYDNVGYMRSGFLSNVANNYSVQLWTDTTLDATSTWGFHSVSKGLWTIRSIKNGYYIRTCDQVEECYQSFGTYPVLVDPAQVDFSDHRFLFEIYDAATRSPIVSYSSCSITCGDGIVVSPETCDTNGGADPGCLNCAIVSGYQCYYNSALSKSVCSTKCGDGLIVGSETCDDAIAHHLVSSGCSDACTVEVGWSCNNTPAPSVCKTVCGDGLVVGSEGCDDKNAVSGDGCTNCAIDTGFRCSYDQVQNKSVCSTVCGDGKRTSVEACDDHNLNPNDGCNPVCAIETGFTCSHNAAQDPESTCTNTCGDGLVVGTEACDDKNAVNGDGCTNCAIDTGFRCSYDMSSNRSVCSTICGDGKRTAVEACDDHNLKSDDGCSPICLIETGFSCSHNAAVDPESNCTNICGDGLVVGIEVCDDKNAVNNDGCTHCLIDAGYRCSYDTVNNRSLCTSICGDGMRTSSEGCDDHNLIPNDGCSSVCVIETGFTCQHNAALDPESNCTNICGDGLVVGKEQCDDKNSVSGDGCTNCRIDAGFQCSYDQTANKTVCVAVCGDGTRTPNEECDDHNLNSNDGCSPVCTFEPGFTCTDVPTRDPNSVCTSICGDGIIVKGEECDDRNDVNDRTDGCSNCTQDLGWRCFGQANSTCEAICNDGYAVYSELCDPSVLVVGSDPGCDFGCRVKPGYICNISDPIFSQRSYCSAICGDGLVVQPERCDTGTGSSGGCTACTIDEGWSCATTNTSSSSVCTPICGDSYIVMGYEECDKLMLGQRLGCNEICQTSSGFSCTNYNSTYGVCEGHCGDGVVVGLEECDDGPLNHVNGDGCNTSCYRETGYVCNFPNTTCELCYGPWTDVTFNSSIVAWESILTELGYNLSWQTSQVHALCSECEGGYGIQTRFVDSHTYCTNISSLILPCSYPCLGLTQKHATEAMSALLSELDKSTFLLDLLAELNISVSWSLTNSKRFVDDVEQSTSAINFALSPCNSSNFSQAQLVLSTITNAIVPSAPAITWANSACVNDTSTVSVASSDPTQDRNDFPVGAVVGGVAGGVLLFIILVAVIIAFMIYRFRHTSDLHLLPKYIRWSYQEQLDENNWSFQGSEVNGRRQGYYYKELRKLRDGEDDNDLSHPIWKAGYSRVMEMFLSNVCANRKTSFLVKQITQIYNKDLVTSFITNWRTQNTRLTDERSQHLFANKTWETEHDTVNDRRLCEALYKERTQDKPWNKDQNEFTSILLTVHGTDLPIAKQIAQTGFANLSSLDAGYYGRGIYFSSFAEYVFLYLAAKRDPAILLSWVACGHILPVVEHHAGPKSLLGAAIKAGYMSHYVRTNSLGFPAKSYNTTDEIFDEVVIPQESQIAPAFILHLARDNFAEIANEWNQLCDGTQAKDSHRLSSAGDGLKALKQHNSLPQVDMSAVGRGPANCTLEQTLNSYRDRGNDGARRLPEGLGSATSPRNLHVAVDLPRSNSNPQITVSI